MSIEKIKKAELVLAVIDGRVVVLKDRHGSPGTDSLDSAIGRLRRAVESKRTRPIGG